jgi:hypothetical protein
VTAVDMTKHEPDQPEHPSMLTLLTGERKPVEIDTTKPIRPSGPRTRGVSDLLDRELALVVHLAGGGLLDVAQYRPTTALAATSARCLQVPSPVYLRSAHARTRPLQRGYGRTSGPPGSRC